MAKIWQNSSPCTFKPQLRGFLSLWPHSTTLHGTQREGVHLRQKYLFPPVTLSRTQVYNTQEPSWKGAKRGVSYPARTWTPGKCGPTQAHSRQSQRRHLGLALSLHCDQVFRGPLTPLEMAPMFPAFSSVLSCLPLSFP